MKLNWLYVKKQQHSINSSVYSRWNWDRTSLHTCNHMHEMNEKTKPGDRWSIKPNHEIAYCSFDFIHRIELMMCSGDGIDSTWINAPDASQSPLRICNGIFLLLFLLWIPLFCLCWGISSAFIKRWHLHHHDYSHHRECSFAL